MNHRSWIFLVGLVMVSCSEQQEGKEGGEGASEPATDSADPSGDEVTWHQDVRPLVDQHCGSCHIEGGVAPFNFDNAAEAAALGPAIVSSVASRTMPPWPADEACRPIQDTQWLDADTMAIFAEWGTADFPVGDPATYVAPRVTEPEPVRDPDLVVLPVEAFRPDFDRTDDVLCNWGDHTFEEPTWVQAASLVSDIHEIVHHSTIYAVPETVWSDIDALDEAGHGPGFPCTGNTLKELPVQAIGGWVPGGEVKASSLSEDAAMLVPAGSRLVIEVHYSLTSAGPDTPTEDWSAVPLWILPEGVEPEWRIDRMVLHYGALDIPAGEETVVQEVEIRVPFEGLLVGSSAHMHALGTRLDTTLLRADGGEECLTRVHPWDPNWQRRYSWVDSLEVVSGDRFRLACTFDNSAENQPEINGIKGDPVDVGWGDGAADEMCIDFIDTAVPWSADASEGVCAGFSDCYAGCSDGEPACTATCMATAGEACLKCGMDAQLGGCSDPSCSDKLWGLWGCLGLCEDPNSDWYGCLMEECAAEYDDYFGCWQTAFEAGDCEDSLESCGGLTP